MAAIRLETPIHAPVERVFDLSLSIDAHSASVGDTEEKAVAGRTSGLIGLGESVTCEATHFGVRQRLTSKITEFDRPSYFVDEMVQGAFKSMRHVHRFEKVEGGMAMRDEFEFQAPLGILGRIAEVAFLEKYMKRFLRRRNAYIKEVAETEEWKRFLVASC